MIILFAFLILFDLKPKSTFQFMWFAFQVVIFKISVLRFLLEGFKVPIANKTKEAWFHQNTLFWFFLQVFKAQTLLIFVKIKASPPSLRWEIQSFVRRIRILRNSFAWARWWSRLWSVWFDRSLSSWFPSSSLLLGWFWEVVPHQSAKTFALAASSPSRVEELVPLFQIQTLSWDCWFPPISSPVSHHPWCQISIALPIHLTAPT